MKIIISILIVSLLAFSNNSHEVATYPKAKVSYSAFEDLVKQVKKHRQKRLINFDQFLAKSKLENVLILDTRSKEMYTNKHIKGAIHLNFSDFTQENLIKLIPNADTTILIYCNNNFEGDAFNFASKIVLPKIIKKNIKPITLALNIPTYINLYGYGYRNVYELSELMTLFDERVEYEGTTIN